MRWFRGTRGTAPPTGRVGPRFHPCSLLRTPAVAGYVEHCQGVGHAWVDHLSLNRGVARARICAFDPAKTQRGAYEVLGHSHHRGALSDPPRHRLRPRRRRELNGQHQRTGQRCGRRRFASRDRQGDITSADRDADGRHQRGRHVSLSCLTAGRVPARVCAPGFPNAHSRRHSRRARTEYRRRRHASRRQRGGKRHGVGRVAGSRPVNHAASDQLRPRDAGIAAQRPGHVVAARGDAVNCSCQGRCRWQHRRHADELLRVRILRPEPSAHRGDQHD